MRCAQRTADAARTSHVARRTLHVARRTSHVARLPRYDPDFGTPLFSLDGGASSVRSDHAWQRPCILWCCSGCSRRVWVCVVWGAERAWLGQSACLPLQLTAFMMVSAWRLAVRVGGRDGETVDADARCRVRALSPFRPFLCNGGKIDRVCLGSGTAVPGRHGGGQVHKVKESGACQHQRSQPLPQRKKMWRKVHLYTCLRAPGYGLHVQTKLRPP